MTAMQNSQTWEGIRNQGHPSLCLYVRFRQSMFKVGGCCLCVHLCCLGAQCVLTLTPVFVSLFLSPFTFLHVAATAVNGVPGTKGATRREGESALFSSLLVKHCFHLIKNPLSLWTKLLHHDKPGNAHWFCLEKEVASWLVLNHSPVPPSPLCLKHTLLPYSLWQSVANFRGTYFTQINICKPEMPGWGFSFGQKEPTHVRRLMGFDLFTVIYTNNDRTYLQGWPGKLNICSWTFLAFFWELLSYSLLTAVLGVARKPTSGNVVNYTSCVLDSSIQMLVIGLHPLFPDCRPWSVPL